MASPSEKPEVSHEKPEVSHTPAEGWAAQPNLTPRETFLQMVRQDVTTLQWVASELEDPRRLGKKVGREELRRVLAGVIAHCETVRLALEKGRTV